MGILPTSVKVSGWRKHFSVSTKNSNSHNICFGRSNQSERMYKCTMKCTSQWLFKFAVSCQPRILSPAADIFQLVANQRWQDLRMIYSISRQCESSSSELTSYWFKRGLCSYNFKADNFDTVNCYFLYNEKKKQIKMIWLRFFVHRFDLLRLTHSTFKENLISLWFMKLQIK